MGVGLAQDKPPVATAGQAVIYVYRPKAMAGMGMSFDVYAGERKICHLKDEEFCTVQLEPGEVEIWSKFVAKGSVTLDVEAGKEYYVRASVTKGIFLLWRPHHAEVLERIGKSEIQACVQASTTSPE